MKFKSVSQEAQHYIMEYFKLNEGKEVSISQFTDYANNRAEKEFSKGVISGIITRISSNPSKTGVARSEINRGYYIYDSKMDRKSQSQEVINKSKDIIRESLTKLKEQAEDMNILECDLKKVSKIKDVIITLEKALKSL